MKVIGLILRLVSATLLLIAVCGTIHGGLDKISLFAIYTASLIWGTLGEAIIRHEMKRSLNIKKI
jgi:hypothetical protein